MYFVFGVKVPSDRVVRVPMRPNFERFVLTNLHKFQVWLHLLILPKGHRPQQLAVAAPPRRAAAERGRYRRPLSRSAFSPTLCFLMSPIFHAPATRFTPM